MVCTTCLRCPPRQPPASATKSNHHGSRIILWWHLFAWLGPVLRLLIQAECCIVPGKLSTALNRALQEQDFRSGNMSPSNSCDTARCNPEYSALVLIILWNYSSSVQKRFENQSTKTEIFYWDSFHQVSQVKYLFLSFPCTQRGEAEDDPHLCCELAAEKATPASQAEPLSWWGLTLRRSFGEDLFCCCTHRVHLHWVGTKGREWCSTHKTQFKLLNEHVGHL